MHLLLSQLIVLLGVFLFFGHLVIVVEPLLPVRSNVQRWGNPLTPHIGPPSFILSPRPFSVTRDMVSSANDGMSASSIYDGDKPVTNTTIAETTTKSSSMSKRNMLGFALPALGIYLSNPLLSNIDNAFVGRTVGTQGLAALSPATICTDQMLYLFSFLGRATTGMVARAHTWNGDTTPARKAAAARESICIRSFHPRPHRSTMGTSLLTRQP